jgi:hypothetical protein
MTFRVYLLLLAAALLMSSLNAQIPGFAKIPPSQQMGSRSVLYLMMICGWFRFREVLRGA